MPRRAVPKKDKKLEERIDNQVLALLTTKIFNDYKVLLHERKNPEPEHFFENWAAVNLVPSFPKEDLKRIWSTFLELLWVRGKK